MNHGDIHYNCRPEMNSSPSPWELSEMQKTPTPQLQIFVEAIESKQRLACTYHGKPRVIEPQCYGIGRKGRELLRVHQVEGGVEAEPLFFASDIGNVRVAGTFAKPGPNYKRNDSAMASIFAQL